MFQSFIQDVFACRESQRKKEKEREGSFLFLSLTSVGLHGEVLKENFGPNLSHFLFPFTLPRWVWMENCLKKIQTKIFPFSFLFHSPSITKHEKGSPPGFSFLFFHFLPNQRQPQFLVINCKLSFPKKKHPFENDGGHFVMVIIMSTCANTPDRKNFNQKQY